MRYTLVKTSYDDLRVNANTQRYKLVAKRCLKLATRVFPSNDYVKELMRCLDKFERQLSGLTLSLI